MRELLMKKLISAASAATICFFNVDDAVAQPAIRCELHVYPTALLTAVDRDTTVEMNYNEMVIHHEFRWFDDIGQSLANSLPPITQIEILRSDFLERNDLFSKYELIYHEDEPWSEERYAGKLEFGTWRGPRASNSKSECYSELRVLNIVYVDQPGKNVLQSAFMLRYFGAEAESQKIGIAAAYEGFKGFVWGPGIQPDTTRSALRDAFSENFGKFLTRSQAKRVLRVMATKEGRRE